MGGGGGGVQQAGTVLGILGASLEHPCTWVGEVKGSGPTDSRAAPRAQWGPRADTPLPLCAPQPDLGAGGREGQLLAVLHHGDGWRHEHLGRQGEVSPRCHGPPRLGPPSIEPSLATALIAVPQRAAVQLLAMVVDPILPTGVPRSWVGSPLTQGRVRGQRWVALSQLTVREGG